MGTFRRRSGAFFVALVLALAPAQAFAHAGINRLTNDFRVDHGLRPLRTNDNLVRLARIRAEQISRVWGHQFWWLNQTSCKWGGENIAMRRPATEPGTRARWFFRMWRDSTSHREQMLGHYHRMASAIYISPDGAMWGVQIFCRR